MRPRFAMRVYKLNSIFLATYNGNKETAATPPAHQSIKARRLPQGKICIGSRSARRTTTQTHTLTHTHTQIQTRPQRPKQFTLLEDLDLKFFVAMPPDDLMG